MEVKAVIPYFAYTREWMCGFFWGFVAMWVIVLVVVTLTKNDS